MESYQCVGIRPPRVLFLTLTCISDWCRLRDHISVTELSTMLHAGLSDDPLEVELLESCVLSRDADYRLTFSWDAFMEALSGITVTDEDPWLADQWYCISCIRELVASRFMHWWTNTKRGSKELLGCISMDWPVHDVLSTVSTPRRAPNCSCGYACDSQTFNPQPEEGELYDVGLKTINTRNSDSCVNF